MTIKLGTGKFVSLCKSASCGLLSPTIEKKPKPQKIFQQILSKNLAKFEDFNTDFVTIHSSKQENLVDPKVAIFLCDRWIAISGE